MAADDHLQRRLRDRPLQHREAGDPPLRLLAATLLLALLLPVGAARADTGCGPDPACVTVEVVGSITATKTFSLADIDSQHDLDQVSYTMRNDGGPSPDEQAASATSVRALVSQVPAPGGGRVDPASVTYTEVYDAHGGAHPLGAGALGVPGSNGFEQLMPSVHFVSANVGLQYLRPLTGPDDVNVSADARNGDFYVVGQPLLIVAHTSGRLLHPTIQPTALSLRVGDTGTFSAQVDGGGTALTYQWDFGDGTASAQTAPTHSWTTAGTYYVMLAVTGADGSSGSATPVKVTVGAAPQPAPSPTASTGTGSHHRGPATGPHQSKGHDAGARPSASSNPSAAPTSGAGPSVPPVAVPTVPSVPPVAPAVPTVPPGPTSGATGPQVQGIVLLQPGQLPRPVTPPTTLTEPTAAAARAAERRLSLPGWIGLPAAGVVLLGLGALTESRAWHRWRGRLRKDAQRE